MTVKKVLLQELSKIEDKDVALLLSGGNGSASVLFALMELGKNVHAYTFHMKNHESTDLIKARELTKKYNIKFTAVPLPDDLETIKKDCKYLINEIGCELKTDVECCFTVKHTFPVVKEKVITSGMGDDNFFVLSKSGQLNYKHSIDGMNKYREKSHAKYEVQLGFFKKMAEKYGITIYSPYQSQGMVDLFHNTSYEEINKPKQKQWILDAFPEKFNESKFYHADFQKGDSNISDSFLKLLESDWNFKGYKRTDGIYNSIKRGEIK